MNTPARTASCKWLVCELLLFAVLISALSGCSIVPESVAPSRQSERETTTETERAFAQEREADMVVVYDTANDLVVTRPGPERHFASENALLKQLNVSKPPKRLLVVILSKRHEWTDPKQTLEGFWEACRRTGFERVVIQRGTAWGRPILHE